MTSRRAHIEGLDGLRAIAVVGVLIAHTRVWGLGGDGVDLFFVLSGFLITGILLDAKTGGAAAWRGYGVPFYMRRALRILPLAYAMIAFVVVIGPRLGWWVPPSRKDSLAFVFYAGNMLSGRGTSGALQLNHFWSLAVEEQFYFIWPWIVLLLSTRWLLLACAGLAVLAPLLRVAVVVLGLQDPLGRMAFHALPFSMDGLAMGAALAAWARTPGATRLGTWQTLGIGLAACGAWLFSYYGEYPSLSYIWSQTAASLMSWAIVSLAVYGAIPWLSARPLAWLGRVSYGMYVVHVPIAFWATDRYSPWVAFALTLPATIAVAAVSWYVFEQPILALKARWPMGTSVQAGVEPPVRECPDSWISLSMRLSGHGR